MSQKAKILIIDDEKSILDGCTQVLATDACDVFVAQDGLSGIRLIRDRMPDLVIVDLKMTGIGGMDVLDKIGEIDSNIVSIVITGYATVSLAVDFMKRGAYDFLPKPFTPDELRIIVKRALQKRSLLLETIVLKEEKETMKRNFITLVSHQLRSPLNSIQQYFEAILSGSVGPLHPQQEGIFRRISKRISGLLTLINEWLDLSRIESGRYFDGFADISLTSLLAEVVDCLKPQAESRNVSLAIEYPSRDCAVKANRKTLKQLFMNLVDNAVKYNKSNGKVSLKLDEDLTHFIVEIQDTGPGIPKESLPFIFDEFYRVENEIVEAISGSGLGLSIAQKIASAHSGFIKVESEVGKGSKFRVWLPK